MWQVVVASLTTGLVIAVYILVMGRLNVDRSVQDPVKTQTIAIARHIIALREAHQSFGYVSLCDSTQENEPVVDVEGRKVSSLNQVKSSLHAAGGVATKLGNKTFSDTVLADLDALEQVQQRLLSRASRAVEPPPAGRQNSTQDNSSLYAQVLRTLKEKDPTDLKTVALSIQLGRYTDEKLLKTVEHPPSESGQAFVSAGCFKSDYPVPVTKDGYVRFSPYADRITLVEPGPFVVGAPGVLPNAVLLEVRYEPRGKSKTEVHIVRRVCALLGGKARATMPNSALFMFRFPHGLSEVFRKPISLLDEQLWKKSGTWQQAAGGSVPGSGTLKLPIDPVLPAMKPHDALALSIYHFIRHLHPAPDPEAVLAVLNHDFPVPPTAKSKSHGEEDSSPVNSCLVADTGARDHSFSKNTDADSKVQRAIEQCFEYPNRLEEYPQSAIPLYVDRSGNLNLSGRTGFDTDLIGNFLNAVYATNLSALESINTAKLVRKQTALENRELELRLSVKQQALSSLAKTLAGINAESIRTKSGAETEALEKQKEEMQKNIESLKATITGITNRKAQLRMVNELTRIALLNADRASARTYELCSTSFTMLRNGLHEFDRPHLGFLIGRKNVFLPLQEPVTESQFFEAASWSLSDRYFEPAKISPWFQKQLPILIPVRDIYAESVKIKANQKTVAEILSEVEVTNNMPPFTVLIDSRELQSRDTAVLHSFDEYPFQGTPVPEDQGLYYAKSATTTGKGNDVIWSVLIRDMVLHELGKGRMIAGPTNTGWEKRVNPPLAGSTALAAEYQLRRPLPRLEGMPAGAYITDPNKRLMTPQIPPVPIELM